MRDTRVTSGPAATSSRPPPRPNPRPIHRLRTIEDVEGARRSDCDEYAACLEQAEIRNWRGFSCNACRAYRQLSPDQLYRDLPKLCRLGNKIRWLVEPPSNDNRRRKEPR